MSAAPSPEVRAFRSKAHAWFTRPRPQPENMTPKSLVRAAHTTESAPDPAWLAHVDGAPKEDAPAQPRTIATLHGADLAVPVSDADLRWLCRGLGIAPGRPTVLVGEGGSRKSWFGMAAALCVASGVRLLGRFAFRTGRVLHLDYEQGSTVSRQRYQALARGMGIDLAGLGDRIAYRWRPMRWRDDPDRVREALLRQVDGFDFVLVDATRGCLPGVNENAVEASVPLDLATDASERTGACFAFVDHAGKPPNEPGGPRKQRHRIRGHSSKLDASQTILDFAAEDGEPSTVTCTRAQLLAPGDWPEPFLFTLSGTEASGLLPVEPEPQRQPPTEGPEGFSRYVEAAVRVIAERPGLASVEGIAAHMPPGMRKLAPVRAAVRQAEASGRVHARGNKQARTYHPGTAPAEDP